MPQYVIERELPGAGSLSHQQLHDISQASCAVLHDMGPDIQWVQSYVTQDRLYCIYLATDAALIKKHAEISGFPATRITETRRVIDPTTALQDAR